MDLIYNEILKSEVYEFDKKLTAEFLERDFIRFHEKNQAIEETQNNYNDCMKDLRTKQKDQNLTTEELTEIAKEIKRMKTKTKPYINKEIKEIHQLNKHINITELEEIGKQIAEFTTKRRRELLLYSIFEPHLFKTVEKPALFEAVF